MWVNFNFWTTIVLTIVLNYYTQAQTSTYVTIAGGDLYKLDFDNCSNLFIGSTGQGFGDIAYTPNGKLWGIENGNLYEINTSNANVTFLGYTSVHAVSLVDLSDTIVLAEFNQNLYGIKTTDATSFLIGNIGYSATGDLTWYDNELYMASAGLLIKIVLNETYTEIISSTPVNNISNPIPGCEGLATVSFSESHNSIIGFSGWDIYEICHVDGSYQIICEEITLPNGIPGAASIRLPTQSPQPGSCQFLSIKEYPNQNTIVQIYPNPFSSQAVLKLTNSLNNATLTVMNCSGKKVKELNNISGQSITLYSDDFASGLYFILLEQNGQIIGREKLILNK